jgi:hypothetical protein
LTLAEGILFALFVGLGVAGGWVFGFAEGVRFQAPEKR